MKKIYILYFVVLFVVLTACGEKSYDGIPKEQNFIASVNILQPSVDFFNDSAEPLASWQLEEAYTGATLVGEDAILLYGNQLQHADLYQLSSGNLKKKIKLKKGTTNTYYNTKTKQFYIANGEYNTVTSYTEQGKQVEEVKTGLYPMAMASDTNFVYVINFKDTFMSVLHADNLKLAKKITIPKSSHGIDFIGNELWIGGHGAGEKPNSKVQRINPTTGELVGEIELPIMPIAFAKLGDDEFVLSHGESKLYELDNERRVIWQKEIGSNPFALTSFQQAIIVAGYDDKTLYWVENHQVTKKVKVGKGPFQLLVREVK
ncbi:MAG: hypothetical protein KBT36_16155 [Kurthia sp.]|nr:hypothetical protein [Candidatus Kurthia equi]